MAKLKRVPKNLLESNPKYKSLLPAIEQASKILLCLAQEQSNKKTLTDMCKAYSILEGTLEIHYQ